MTEKHDLDAFEMEPASLEREWVVTIDTPVAGMDLVLEALGREVPLIQGAAPSSFLIERIDSLRLWRRPTSTTLPAKGRIVRRSVHEQRRTARHHS